MNFFHRLFFIIIFLLITSCGDKNKSQLSEIKDQNIELQMIDAYKEGKEALDKGDALFAAKKFNEAEILFPQSKWAPRAVLMAAYSYYSQEYYGDAVYEMERFIKTYPKHPEIPYAHYFIGICFYENIADEKKDLKPLVRAKKKFEFILSEYPNTDFALDAKFKLDLIADVLASKEIYIAKYYIQKEKWIAAINRLKNVVENYSSTIYVEEALHRLVEIHYKLGLDSEAKKYAAILGYNYQSSQWYKESYRIFNKDYESIKEKTKQKKENKIIKKIKSLFD